METNLDRHADVDMDSVENDDKLQGILNDPSSNKLLEL